MKARVAKKILKRIAVAHLEPGDVVVFRHEWSLSPEQELRIRQVLKRMFPNNEVVVIPQHASLTVIRPDSTQSEATVE